ncbi:hypothetical protein PR048_019541 [Dryococelus australis]|uniref:Uncharacterized protein n=1 Tax=Dryococelus australis TaxID=614101 RepID=A0ABQ9H3R9_9NEOP|nr:hypothetical protein PR048_019541 [Dryococelus australis]
MPVCFSATLTGCDISLGITYIHSTVILGNVETSFTEHDAMILVITPYLPVMAPLQIPPGVSYTNALTRSGERGGHATDLPRPIQRSKSSNLHSVSEEIWAALNIEVLKAVSVKRSEYEAAPECKSKGNGRFLRKPADQRVAALGQSGARQLAHVTSQHGVASGVRPCVHYCRHAAVFKIRLSRTRPFPEKFRAPELQKLKSVAYRRFNLKHPCPGNTFLYPKWRLKRARVASGTKTYAVNKYCKQVNYTHTETVQQRHSMLRSTSLKMAGAFLMFPNVARNMASSSSLLWYSQKCTTPVFLRDPRGRNPKELGWDSERARQWDLQLCSIQIVRGCKAEGNKRRWATRGHALNSLLSLAVKQVNRTDAISFHPPTKTIRVQPPAGSLRIFACGNHARRCRQSEAFLRDLSFPHSYVPALLQTHLASPSSALKTSILRAAQISSLTHSFLCKGMKFKTIPAYKVVKSIRILNEH